MNPLLELADRVEAATGPDRELDDAIATCIFEEPQRVCVKGLSDEAGGMWMFRYPNGSIGSSLRFTGSLDAAMTLVPEGSGYNLDRYWIREGARWKVEIGTGGTPEQPRQVFDCWDAHTAARATTAASLRAIASMGSSG